MPRSKRHKQRDSELTLMTVHDLRNYVTCCERMERTVKAKKARHAWKLVKEQAIREIGQREDQNDSS